MWQRYLTSLKTHPVSTNAVTALTITLFGDILAQKLEHKFQGTFQGTSSLKPSSSGEKAINWERCLTVSSYWTLASTPTLLWFRWLDSRFPIPKVNASGLFTLARKLTVHLGIFAPTINACFYGWLILKSRYYTHGAVDKQINNRTEAAKPDQTLLQEWLTKLDNDLLETMKNSVMTWGTAQTFNFLFLPPHTRVLFTSVISIFWTAYVSVVGHREQEEVVESLIIFDQQSITK